MAELATDTDLYSGALLAIDFTKYHILALVTIISLPQSLFVLVLTNSLNLRLFQIYSATSISGISISGGTAISGDIC